MKLEEKHYYWIGAVVILISAGVIIHHRNKNKAVGSPGPKTLGEGNEEIIDESIFPLQFGSSGVEVKAIQKYLNTTCNSDLKKMGLYPLEVNGVWDETTEKATLGCSVFNRNQIDEETLDRVLRDLQSANISI